MEHDEVKVKVEAAFLELLKMMPNDVITTAEIIEQAGVSQDEYNLFFTNQRSIIVSFLHRLHRQIMPELDKANETGMLLSEENITQVFAFYGQYHAEYLAMEASGFSNLIFDETRTIVEELLQYGDNGLVNQMHLEYITGGMLSVFFSWLRVINQLTVQEVGHQLYQMVIENLPDLESTTLPDNK